MSEALAPVGQMQSGDLIINDDVAREIDQTIRTIPQDQLRAPDRNAPGLDFEVSKDPFTLFERMRQEHGDVVAYKDGGYGGCQVFPPFAHPADKPNFGVFGYDAIRTMVQDPEHFVNEDAYGGHGKASGKVMVNELDGDQHRFMRRIFDTDILGRQRLIDYAEGSVEPMARHLVKRINTMLDNGEPVDMCRDLALPLIYSSVARIIGLPIVDLSYFVKTAEAAFSGNRDLEAAMAAVAELTGFFSREYEARLSEGRLTDGDDLISMMASVDKDGFKFTGEDIIAYCGFLLPAGIETTWRQTANMCLGVVGTCGSIPSIGGGSYFTPGGH